MVDWLLSYICYYTISKGTDHISPNTSTETIEGELRLWNVFNSGIEILKSLMHTIILVLVVVMGSSFIPDSRVDQ